MFENIVKLIRDVCQTIVSFIHLWRDTKKVFANA